MNKYLIPAALALAALAAAGCGSSASHPAAAHTVTSPAAAPSPAAPSPSPTASPAPAARLTIRQAKRAYVAIVDPYNRDVAGLNQDYTDRAPMAQFRRDSRAEVAALRLASARLSAVRWPAAVAPYVSAMVSTDLAVSIRCVADQSRAMSYAQVDSMGFNRACTEAQNTSSADTIRSLLNLPSLGG